MHCACGVTSAPPTRSSLEPSLAQQPVRSQDVIVAGAGGGGATSGGAGAVTRGAGGATTIGSGVGAGGAMCSGGEGAPLPPRQDCAARRRNGGSACASCA